MKHSKKQPKHRSLEALKLSLPVYRQRRIEMRTKEHLEKIRLKEAKLAILDSKRTVDECGGES